MRTLKDEHEGLKIKLLCANEQTDKDQASIKKLKKEKSSLEIKLKYAEDELQVERAILQDSLKQYVNNVTLLKEKMGNVHIERTRQLRQELQEKDNEIERLTRMVSEQRSELNASGYLHTECIQIQQQLRQELIEKDREIERLKRIIAKVGFLVWSTCK